ncbi:hypothetical protein HHK36_004202 [Tetracentron sinense]|uniref:Uncharacterized protein n=1 Tax=Tetracentron sinense TaxID=13715 RepID=A0A834ZPM2_TETSI|nr:hypothetical protein HHK36_004202 [Tetracentron sinense]
MAALEANDQISLNDAKLAISDRDVERQTSEELKEKNIDYSQRSQWLRAAVLGANDGLVSTAFVDNGDDPYWFCWAAAASALAFSVGAMVPLLAASFIKEKKVRLGGLVGVWMVWGSVGKDTWVEVFSEGKV